VRPSSQKAVEYIAKKSGGADLVMVAGDILGGRGDWDKNTIKSTLDASYKLFRSASSNGKVMIATGNHDCSASALIGAEKVNSNDYSEYLKKDLGDFEAALFSTDIEAQKEVPFEEILCYRYKINGLDFIGINTPYGDRRQVGQKGYNGLYLEQVEWLEKELKSIGKDKTVFVLCHYPLDMFYTVTASFEKTDISDKNESLLLMTKIHKEYPNMIYCCGHTHIEEDQARFEASEVIRPYVKDGAITCHLGSLAYYNDHYGGHLTNEDTKVIQTTLIKIYSDKIIFEKYNTGEKSSYGGNYQIKPLVIKRDLSKQLQIETKTNLFKTIFK